MRRCKAPGCTNRFEANGMVVWCCPDHAVAIARVRIEASRAQKAKEERRNDRERKAKMLPRSHFIKEAQREFNRYIRFRDAGKPCICCDVPLAPGGARSLGALPRPAEWLGGEFDCGHYRSVGSAPHLRFDERNAHAQRKQCNRYGAGRAVDYRKGLIRRIGLSAVEELESDQAPKHYSIEDLKAIKAEYRRKARELEKQ